MILKYGIKIHSWKENCTITGNVRPEWVLFTLPIFVVTKGYYLNLCVMY